MTRSTEPIGGGDAFVAKYSATGALLWTRQLGTSTSDFSTGVATDGDANVYISGGTQLVGANESAAGAWLAKYSTEGALRWKRQVRTSETITHLAFYSGWPTAMTALQIAKRAFEEAGV